MATFSLHDRGCGIGFMSSQFSLSTSTSLLDRVRRREADAWSRLARLYSPLVYRWARQCGLQADDAADVVQETFLAVASHVDRFAQSEASTFRGWLWTITRNQVRLHFRKHQAISLGVGGSDANNALLQYPAAVEQDEEPAGFDANGSLVHRALEIVRADFNERTWQAFVRVTISGEQPCNVAADLGMTSGAVRQAKYRVLSRLHDELTSS